MSDREDKEVKAIPKEEQEVVELPSERVKVGSEAVPAEDGDAGGEKAVKELEKAAKEKLFPEPTSDD